MIRRFILVVCFVSLSYQSSLSAEKTKSYSSEEMVSILENITKLRMDAKEQLHLNNYLEAKALYFEILRLDAKYWLKRGDYNDVLLCLAYSQIQLNLLEEARQTLHLIHEDEFQEHYYRKEILLSQIHFFEGDKKQSLLILNHLKTVFPLKSWVRSDQNYFLKVKEQMKKFYEDLITQAERCFEASLYKECIPAYQEVIQALENNLYQTESGSLHNQLNLRIGYAYFYQKEYEKAQNLIMTIFVEDKEIIHPDALYLLILSLRELKEYETALEYCQTYLVLPVATPLGQKDAVKFEMGLLHYKMNLDSKAQRIFESLITDLKMPHYKNLSRFYLARLHLKKGSYKAVEDILRPDLMQFEEEDPLRYEWAYLRAEAFYYRGEYSMAAAGFEESLPDTNRRQAEWRNNALYNLGWSYLKLAEDPLTQEVSQEEYSNKAQRVFLELLKTNKEDKSYLGLARVYLLRYELLGNKKAGAYVESLLADHKYSSIENETEGGLILAEVRRTFEEKELIYHYLTSSKFEGCPQYGLSWYYRGLNNYDKAIQKGKKEFYEDAIQCFTKAHEQLKERKIKETGLCIKYTALAYLNLEKEAKYLEGYETLKSMLEDLESNEKERKLIDELFYLQALFCSKLIGHGEEYFNRGVETLNRLIAFEDKEIADQALYLLGSLYFQHKDFRKASTAFSDLIRKFPHSDHVPSSWFWAAECSDLEDNDPSIAREYRRTIFETFPESEYAPEAYFHFYSFAEYLQGNFQAMQHLKAMEKYFASSPYLIVSYYLQALDLKQDRRDPNGRVITRRNLSEANKLFIKVKDSFLKSLEEQQMDLKYLQYFTSIYYRSSLAQALTYMERADANQGAKRQLYLEQSIEIFQSICEDFSDKQHPLTAQFYKVEKFPKFYEEALFGLAKALINNYQVTEAEKILSHMIESYNILNIKQNYYLSRSWYEIALIAMAKEEFHEALDYLKHAELAADDQILTADQKVDLGIQQSLCYRFLDQLDMSMLTLSKIINEGIVSNLRIKAMFLRAEIYELQGRRELAQKQLEAAAKAGGDWGRMSQEKLVREYGFN